MWVGRWPNRFSPRWPGLNNGTVGLGTTNVVRVIQFNLLQRITVRKVVLDLSAASAGAGTHAFIGIYDSAGTTRLIEAIFDGNAGAVVQSVTLGAAVTLNPGVYWFAFGGDTTNTITARMALVTLVGASNSMNQNTVRWGTASTTISAGHLPSTIGTPTATGISSLPCAFLEP